MTDEELERWAREAWDRLLARQSEEFACRAAANHQLADRQRGDEPMSAPIGERCRTDIGGGLVDKPRNLPEGGNGYVETLLDKVRQAVLKRWKRGKRSTVAEWIQLEPGDGTHYEFLVASVPETQSGSASIFIASVSRGSGCPAFVGCAYTVADLVDFAKRFPKILSADRSQYQHTVMNESVLDDYFVKHAQQHSGMGFQSANPWTALAAIRAGLIYLRVVPL